MWPFWAPHITKCTQINGKCHRWRFLAECPPGLARCSHLKNTQALVNIWQATETSQDKSRLINFLAVVHTWIVSLYIQPLNIGQKCIFVCVPIRMVLANPVTYYIILHIIIHNILYLANYMKILVTLIFHAATSHDHELQKG